MGDPTFDEKVRSVKSGLILNSSDSSIGKLPLFVFVYLLCKFGDTFFMKEEIEWDVLTPDVLFRKWVTQHLMKK